MIRLLRSPRARRRLLLTAAIMLAVQSSAIWILAAPGVAASGLALYGGTVSAWAARVAVENSGVPTGVPFDSTFAGVASTLNSTPSASTRAAAYDPGALAATAAQSAGGVPFYADARYPGFPDAAAASSQSQGGLRGFDARAHADERATRGSATVADAESAAFRSSFSTSLRSWAHSLRAALAPVRAAGFGTDVSSSDALAHFEGLTTQGGASAGDAQVSSAETHVAFAELRAGTVVVRNAHSTASTRSAGCARADCTAATLVLDAGEVSIAGVPVSVGADGVRIAGQPDPGAAGALAQANDTLEQTLLSYGLDVRVLKLRRGVNGGEAAAAGSALTVRAIIRSAAGVGETRVSVALASVDLTGYAGLPAPPPVVSTPARSLVLWPPIFGAPSPLPEPAVPVASPSPLPGSHVSTLVGAIGLTAAQRRARHSLFGVSQGVMAALLPAAGWFALADRSAASAGRVR